MRYSSAHSKLIKRGVAFSSLKQSVQKSCPHKIAQSVNIQVERLKCSEFPDCVIASVAEKLLKTINGKKNGKSEESATEKARPIVLPYIHTVSHKLKKIANAQNVELVFSAPEKLIGMCRRVNGCKGRSQSNNCGINHVRKFVECNKEVVYDIPLTCGRRYVGQTERCLNTRLREHRNNCQLITHPGNLATHVSQCKCEPLFEKTTILSQVHDKMERVITESYMMTQAHADECISAPSINLSSKEIHFIGTN